MRVGRGAGEYGKGGLMRAERGADGSGLGGSARVDRGANGGGELVRYRFAWGGTVRCC